ncbi:hypothetical protein HAX54_015149 [Datura stramonium]|uniref:Uncharacterized protein n=1 Tax=Datura stramonium TaxID=4076 RepID=A0ABS8RZG5_DATST|nr:hypothetical protein [Datura stramonium]
MERECDESTFVSDDVESNDQNVTTSIFCNDEDRDADFHYTLLLPLLLKPSDNVTTGEEVEKINGETSINGPFAIKKSPESDDLVEAKCSIEFFSASASNTRMELEESLQENDVKDNPTEDADLNALTKKLHVANFPKEKHRSMWSLIPTHMISNESTELDNKFTCGDDE